MENQTSGFDMLKGKVNFTTEPLWFRLVAYFIKAAIYLTLVYLLKEWHYHCWQRGYGSKVWKS